MWPWGVQSHTVTPHSTLNLTLFIRLPYISLSPPAQARASTLEAEASGLRMSLEGPKRGEAMWHDKYTNLLEK